MTASSPPLTRRLLAEFLGTFGLVFFGTGAVVFDANQDGALGGLWISIVFGLAVTAMILLFGTSSGAHINPAVTVGLVAARRWPAREIVPYVLAQCAGAVAGSAAVLALLGDAALLGATTTGHGLPAAFGIEVLLTLVLMYVILRVTSDPDVRLLRVALVVGAAVAALAYLGGPHTGASMNPARSVGPALVSGHLDVLWLYLLAPVVGAVLAFPACRLTSGRDSPCCRAPETCP